MWIADIDRTLANVLLAAQQLNQLLGEVKTSPWRLLYRPTDKQLGQELIYEASRNFVFGAADLKSAAGAMERLLEARGASLTADDAQLEALRSNLMDSADRYQRAQEQLMELLKMTATIDAVNGPHLVTDPADRGSKCSAMFVTATFAVGTVSSWPNRRWCCSDCCASRSAAFDPALAQQVRAIRGTSGRAA